ncbi:hypothetical protein V5P93_005442 [Actinokineospora auranticolor]|uniref:hypothetical protein n=1 Tax=Actinokineospora auranticolor TaxID=155976 RepID=UPI0015E432B1|nr:hypothetical protein [Actinokineospora auranticolor]
MPGKRVPPDAGRVEPVALGRGEPVSGAQGVVASSGESGTWVVAVGTTGAVRGGGTSGGSAGVPPVTRVAGPGADARGIPGAELGARVSRAR